VTVDIRWDPAAFEELLDSPEGPVGQLLIELSDQVAAAARDAVRVRETPTWSRRSNAREPGFTRATIRSHLGRGAYGLYGGVNAAADPSIFLEQPASQMHRRYPFLTTGLWSIAGEVG
jgi:hypothetical protein